MTRRPADPTGRRPAPASARPSRQRMTPLVPSRTASSTAARSCSPTDGCSSPAAAVTPTVHRTASVRSPAARREQALAPRLLRPAADPAMFAPAAGRKQGPASTLLRPAVAAPPVFAADSACGRASASSACPLAAAGPQPDAVSPRVLSAAAASGERPASSHDMSAAAARKHPSASTHSLSASATANRHARANQPAPPSRPASATTNRYTPADRRTPPSTPLLSATPDAPAQASPSALSAATGCTPAPAPAPSLSASATANRHTPADQPAPPSKCAATGKRHAPADQPTPPSSPLLATANRHIRPVTQRPRPAAIATLRATMPHTSAYSRPRRSTIPVWPFTKVERTDPVPFSATASPARRNLSNLGAQSGIGTCQPSHRATNPSAPLDNCPLDCVACAPSFISQGREGGGPTGESARSPEIRTLNKTHDTQGRGGDGEMEISTQRVRGPLAGHGGRGGALSSTPAGGNALPAPSASVCTPAQAAHLSARPVSRVRSLLTPFTTSRLPVRVLCAPAPATGALSRAPWLERGCAAAPAGPRKVSSVETPRAVHLNQTQEER